MPGTERSWGHQKSLAFILWGSTNHHTEFQVSVVTVEISALDQQCWMTLLSVTPLYITSKNTVIGCYPNRCYFHTMVPFTPKLNVQSMKPVNNVPPPERCQWDVDL